MSSRNGVVLFALLVTVGTAAAFTCGVFTSPQAGQTLIMSLSNDSNAHGELPTQSNYGYYVYCTNESYTITTSCSGANILNLSNATNAHASVVPDADHTDQICIDVDETGITCSYTSGSVPAGSTCVVTMSNESNAHLAGCASPETYKVYCSFSDSGVPTWSNNITNATSTTPRYNEFIEINLTMHDDLDLDSYIFSWNDSGSFVNDSSVSISGTEHTMSLSKQVTRTRGETIGWKVYFNDSAGNTNETPIFSFTMKNTLPDVPVLDELEDGADTFDRTPTFNWTGNDVDGDALTYNLSITCQGGCSADNRTYESIAGENYTVPTDLEYLFDDGYHYTWTVLACDPFGCGASATERNFTISGLVSLFFSRNSTDFGVLEVGENASSTDDSPLPLEVTNDGNVPVNLTVYASPDLFVRAAHPTSFFRILARDDGSNSYASANTSFFDVPPPANPEQIVEALNYVEGNNTVSYDLYVESPLDEPGGEKQTTITTIGSRS